MQTNVGRVMRESCVTAGLAVLMISLSSACEGQQHQPAETVAGTGGKDRGSASSSVTSRTGAGDDPCRYLAASEVEPYAGPLVSPPFRVGSSDAVPSRSGDACLYRGKDGRGVLVTYSAHGGRVAGTAARRVPAVMDRILSQGPAGGQGDQQGPAAAVMGPVGPGPWDNSNWFPTGTLIVYKGDAAFDIDMSATSGGKDGAIDLATKAIGRLGQPLDYDGTRAVAFAPKPVPRVPACDLIPRARAEGILGTMSKAPKADSAGTTCTYTVASADGDVSYPVAITWGNGYKQLNMLKHGMSSMTGALGSASKTFNVGAGPAVQVPSRRDSGDAGVGPVGAEDAQGVHQNGRPSRHERRGDARDADRFDPGRAVGRGGVGERQLARGLEARRRGYHHRRRRRL